MQEVRITSAHVNDEPLKRLYQTAFPEDEQIPWTDLMRLIDQMNLDFTAYYDNDELTSGQVCSHSGAETCSDSSRSFTNLIGFTIVYPRKSFNWFWYFAVREDIRGKGYGQQILAQLMKKYEGQVCVLDMESPYQNPCDNSEQRKRRHAFYLRNGFRDTNVYRTYNDIEMTIMITGSGTFTIQDWDEIVNELRTYWTWD